MLTHGSLFTGIGLLDYGLMLAGFDAPEWVVERDEWRRGVLAKRFPDAAQLDDIRDAGAHSLPRVDVIAGGFPCKGASTAGKQTGFDHPETVLWREMFRAVRELRPRYVLVENVANILALYDGAVWGEVLGDLASLGFDIEWDCLPAAAVGAPHRRDRVFAVATHPGDDGRWSDVGRRDDRGPDGSAGRRVEGPSKPDRGVAAAADPNLRRRRPHERVVRPGEPDAEGRATGVDWGEYRPAIDRWSTELGRRPGEPLLQGVDDGAARRVVRSRLSALGDGVQVQVAQVVGSYILEREAERMKAGTA